ncbi:MAG: hypothetical protein WCB68_21880 [Pyrinomonadaceae bacterium]
MLFVESKSSGQTVEGALRIALLEKLQEKGLVPLIRSTRLYCYEQALLSPERVSEMERAIASWAETEDGAMYVRGDVFCFIDSALFLIFGEEGDETAGMRAGIVYGAELDEPLIKLNAFCRSISDALESLQRNATRSTGAHLRFDDWTLKERSASQVFARFGGVTDASDQPLERADATLERVRALEILEDAEARRWLRRIREAHLEGRVADLLADETSELNSKSLINRMSDAGLVRREVLVSCRKVGRALFRLPSPDALSVITASRATCSECGAAIADEKVEELIAPTEATSTLLEDGSWLAHRLRIALNELGVPDKQIATGPTDGDGETHILVDVCNEPFLFMLRDGDVAASHARRALDKLAEIEGAHLVVISSGKIQEDARVRLREHARRRGRGRSETEVILIEGMDTAASELQQAFERVSQKALAEELYELDSSLGLSVGFMIAARFRLMRHRPGTLNELAESAVGAIAGSLREI